MDINHLFHKISQKVAGAVGSTWAFLVALSICVIWALTGPHFHYSETWQLVINTGTTIITFLMVFLIQNTQNRDAKAFHLKLDELIRAHHGARNMMVDLENCTEEELEQLHKEFERVRKKAVFRNHQKRKDGNPPDAPNAAAQDDSNPPTQRNAYPDRTI